MIDQIQKSRIAINTKTQIVKKRDFNDTNTNVTQFRVVEEFEVLFAIPHENK